jgi:putative pyruvate formate lyase activating enzyme
MTPCNLCPRQCNVDRSRSLGWCKLDDRIHISSIVIHRGEEPPISGEKGIVNIFFPSCNMQCIYCQNREISCRGTQGTLMSLNEVCDAIINLLPLSENNLGFVSPTHCIPQMISIVEELRKRGHHPTIIYNTNGYDLPETISSLEGIVDVWLPDFKYSDDSLAQELSQAPDYSKYALSSLKTMVHQTGTTLLTDERGIARRGIIIRHLVLPGFVGNSVGVLKVIAENISPNLHISLMSQYYPPDNILVKNRKSQIADHKSQLEDCKSQIPNHKSLHRNITRGEYEAVLEAYHVLGFTRGWLQDFESHLSYRPDFSRDHPFE